MATDRMSHGDTVVASVNGAFHGSPEDLDQSHLPDCKGPGGEWDDPKKRPKVKYRPGSEKDTRDDGDAVVSGVKGPDPEVWSSGS